MTVQDCMREIRMANDAISILNKYAGGEMNGIADQHITEIKDVIEKYIDLIAEKEVR